MSAPRNCDTCEGCGCDPALPLHEIEECGGLDNNQYIEAKDSSGESFIICQECIQMALGALPNGDEAMTYLPGGWKG